jgi:hypothetical protein
MTCYKVNVFRLHFYYVLLCESHLSRKHPAVYLLTCTSVLEGKSPLGRPRRRWENNILHEVGGDCGEWIELALGRDRWRALVSTVKKLCVPKMRGISWLAAKTG